jgi:hypothetical protein
VPSLGRGNGHTGGVYGENGEDCVCPTNRHIPEPGWTSPSYLVWKGRCPGQAARRGWSAGRAAVTCRESEMTSSCGVALQLQKPVCKLIAHVLEAV